MREIKMFLMYDLVPSLLLYDLVPAEVASYPPLQNTFHLKVKICLKDTKRRIKTSFNLKVKYDHRSKFSNLSNWKEEA